jgi:hypothetical protein
MASVGFTLLGLVFLRDVETVDVPFPLGFPSIVILWLGMVAHMLRKHTLLFSHLQLSTNSKTSCMRVYTCSEDVVTVNVNSLHAVCIRKIM